MDESPEPAANEAVVPPEPAADTDERPAPPRSSARRIILWTLIAVIVLGGAAFAWIRIQDLQTRLDDAQQQDQQQDQQIRQQQDEIQQQNGLLDKKESFGMAMDKLMAVLRQYDGVPLAETVPLAEIQAQADTAWQERRSPDAMDAHTAVIVGDTAQLQNRLTAAEAERAGNASGTLPESILDGRGDGFVEVAYDDTAALCGKSDAIGCFDGADPYVVHLDAHELRQPYTDDWAKTLITDHEFAHVLQFWNPGPTADALAAFGGDDEFMADCYALTMTNGWTLTHVVTTSRWIYTTSYGYGRVCDASQRQVIADWVSQVGYHYAPIAQG